MTILVCVCGRTKLAGKKQNIDPMWKVLNKEVDLGTLTSFLPCFFFFFFLQLVHRKTQLSCTIHSLTSVHAHLDRTGLESIVFSETSAVLSSCTRTWWRSRFVEMAEPLDAQLLKDPRGLGKPLSFDETTQSIKTFATASEST